MSAFDALRAGLLSSPLAVDALYRVGGVDPAIPMRLIPSQPDAIIGGGLVQSSVSTVLKVSTADATPAEGDTFEIAGTIYTVAGSPRRDARRLFWIVEAPPES